jgi:hypothetical protein
MMFVRAYQEVFGDVSPGVAEARGDGPDRVYVRVEQCGRLHMILWGVEHVGLRSEAVERFVPSRPSAAWVIERDLRRGVGLRA